MWIITDHPSDFPESFVARRWDDAYLPTSDYLHSPDLDTLREQMRIRGLVRIPRDRDDDPVIVESWI